MYLGYTTQCSDIFLHCGIFTTIKLINICITLYNCRVCVCVRVYVYNESTRFQVHKTLLLTIVTALH
jgi:hypothetical protein